MSMIAITYLHEIVRRNEAKNPGNTLNIMRERIKSTFKTFGSDNQNGLDIAFCVLNTKTNIIQYAGAYNPLWLIRNKEFIEHKATRNPIGFYIKEVDFKNHEIQLEKNDFLYIFSDGYQDQFDAKRNKFSKKRFRELIIEIHTLPLPEQKIKLQKTLEQWKGNSNQIDDITVMGIKI